MVDDRVKTRRENIVMSQSPRGSGGLRNGRLRMAGVEGLG